MRFFAQQIHKQKGYTLLFSVIVSTIVLSITAFVLSVSRKQFILTSAARDSTIAIYAADSGIQCAVEAYNQGYFNYGDTSSINCNGINITPTYVSTQSSPAGTNFDVTKTINQTAPMVFDVGGKCVKIIVTDGTDTSGSHLTVIDSFGYNVGCTDGTRPDAGPRTTERAIRLQYHG